MYFFNHYFFKKNNTYSSKIQKVFLKQKKHTTSVAKGKKPFTSLSKRLKANKLKPSKLTFVKNLLQTESVRMGSIEPHPKRRLEHLKKQSLLLKEADFAYLFKEVSNTQSNGDRRFLSVYLLSLSQNSKAKPYLEKIISASINQKIAAPRLYEQELVIKMHAIKGFLPIIKAEGSYQAQAKQLLQRQENPFLVKFIRNLL
ncbi:MAG: hypothetical protein HAW63_04645 [Bdellovibrionaceae bacterium]|nr:hypothetical protein [Pseudobdellovibrionaceae bacterium]